LTVGELAAHTHAVTIDTVSANAGPDVRAGDGTGGGSATTSSVGSDDPHNNMPPFLALNYIIKT
jgi:microcystin-dependent protein